LKRTNITTAMIQPLLFAASNEPPSRNRATHQANDEGIGKMRRSINRRK